MFLINFSNKLPPFFRGPKGPPKQELEVGGGCRPTYLLVEYILYQSSFFSSQHNFHSTEQFQILKSHIRVHTVSPLGRKFLPRSIEAIFCLTMPSLSLLSTQTMEAPVTSFTLLSTVTEQQGRSSSNGVSKARSSDPELKILLTLVETAKKQKQKHFDDQETILIWNPSGKITLYERKKIRIVLPLYPLPLVPPYPLHRVKKKKIYIYILTPFFYRGHPLYPPPPVPPLPLAEFFFFFTQFFYFFKNFFKKLFKLFFLLFFYFLSPTTP